jgi:acyl homoserine lactone synthase
MQLNVKIAARKNFPKPILYDMHRLRAKVFCERKGWKIPTMGGMEIDGYDAIDPLYMLMHEPNGLLRGCWRLLPTEGPYMLKDTFPELLHEQVAPEDARIWELSRFAIETKGEQAFGFSSIAMQSIEVIIRYGHEHNIEQYVTVTTISIERMLRRAGVVTRRLGSALKIGVETAVAIYIDIESSLKAIANPSLHLPDLLN